MALEPILNVGGFGRSGSTLLMALLGTNARIAFDRSYPFEVRYLTYLSQQSLLLSGASWPADDWTEPSQASETDAGRRVGLVDRLRRRPAPANTESGADRRRPLEMDPVNRPPRQIGRADGPDARLWQLGVDDPTALYGRLLRSQWSIVSDVLVDGHRRDPEGTGDGPVVYAEKVNWNHARLMADALELRLVVLRVRDPRDVWASIAAFDRKRGFYGFGRQPGESSAEYLQRWLPGVRDYLAWVTEQRGRDGFVTVRYEDLATEPLGPCAALEEHLGLELDPDLALGEPDYLSDHKTASSPEASVGRHTDDVDPAETSRIEDHLGDLMSSFGYQT